MGRNLSGSMTAINFTEPGGVEVLQLLEQPLPQPQAGELLVKVAAAGVNRADIILRQRDIPLPVKNKPQVPGLEVAGEVVALGSGVEGFAIGDRVCGLTPAGGGYAEYARLPAALAWPVPEVLSSNEAAALPEALLTVWNALFATPVVKPGESLLVHGGSSGIGSIAIKLTRALGIAGKLLATAGSEEKCAAMTSWGADRAINYRDEDFVKVVEEETTDGVDVTLDMVGGDYLARNIQAAAVKGRIVQIGMMQSPQGTVPIPLLMARRLSLIGASIWFQSVAEKAQLAAQISKQVWPKVAAGEIRPVIDKVFPLAEVREAQLRMEQGAHIGKILLTPNLP